MDQALYLAGERQNSQAVLHDLYQQAKSQNGFVWVGMHQPSQTVFAEVAEIFGLHQLAVEDAINAQQRPKLEQYDNSVFISLKTLWYVEPEDAVESGEINIFCGHNFVITVRHGEGSELAGERKQLEARPELCRLGPTAVVHAVCDAVVDNYELVAAAIEIDVDEVEASVFSTQRTNDSSRIYVLKREIAEIRRAVAPLREPMRRLASGGLELFHSEAAPFFRDVADHLARVTESIDSSDLLLSTAFESHMAEISMRQNEDMRKISAGVALVAVPTLIAGVYGMNFNQMPELSWAFGYPFALLLMGVSSLGLWIYFKKSGWL